MFPLCSTLENVRRHLRSKGTALFRQAMANMRHSPWRNGFSGWKKVEYSLSEFVGGKKKSVHGFHVVSAWGFASPGEISFLGLQPTKLNCQIQERQDKLLWLPRPRKGLSTIIRVISPCKRTKGMFPLLRWFQKIRLVNSNGDCSSKYQKGNCTISTTTFELRSAVTLWWAPCCEMVSLKTWDFLPNPIWWSLARSLVALDGIIGCVRAQAVLAHPHPKPFLILGKCCGDSWQPQSAMGMALFALHWCPCPPNPKQANFTWQG